MGGVQEEINEMLNVLDGTSKEEVKEPEEKEEVIEEKEEVEEKEEETEEEETKEEGKEETKEEEELDDKDKTIAELRAQIDKLSGKKVPEEEKEKDEEEPKKREFKEEPLKLETHDFIGDEDLDDLVRDKDLFNKLLNSVYSKGVADAKKIATEGVLLSIPEIVRHNITLQNTLKEISKKFYEDNGDLAGFKKVVAAVFEEVAADNPGKDYAYLMDLVAPEARKRLGLSKVAKREEREEKKTPRLPEKKGGARQTPSKPNTSSLQSEIDEMNKSIGR